MGLLVGGRHEPEAWLRDAHVHPAEGGVACEPCALTAAGKPPRSCCRAPQSADKEVHPVYKVITGMLVLSCLLHSRLLRRICSLLRRGEGAFGNMSGHPFLLCPSNSSRSILWRFMTCNIPWVAFKVSKGTRTIGEDDEADDIHHSHN